MRDIVERLRLIGLWRTPGGPTPKEKMPSTYKAVTEAADEIERLRAVIHDARRTVNYLPYRNTEAMGLIERLDAALKERTEP